MTVIEDFRREIRNILGNVVKGHRRGEDYYRNVMHLDRTLSFPKNIAGSYTRAIRILRSKAENVGRLISDEALVRVLDDFLIDFKYGDEVKKLAEIDRHIVKLFDRVKNMQSERHLFIIPIMNLFLEQDTEIGDGLLVNLTEHTLATIESRHSVRIRFPKEGLSQTAKKILKRNKTSAYAVVQVEAPDDDMALELAMQRADTCLNVLRLYHSTAPFVVRDEFRSNFPRGMVHLNIDKKSYGEMSSQVNLVVNIPTIDTDAVEKMNKAGLSIINRLLSKKNDELTQLQKDILTAILWFGNAVKETQRNMKFIKSVIALETLLVPDGGFEKRNRISNRFTSIMYAQTSDEEKKEVFLSMRSLYNIRNSIIHSGEGFIHEEDLNQIMYWTQVTIQYSLRYAEK